jgi:hypothetical protein
MKLFSLLFAAMAALFVPLGPVAAADASNDDAIETAINAAFAFQPPHSALAANERRELADWIQEAVGQGLVPVDLSDPRQLRMVDLMQKAARRPPISQILPLLGDTRAVREKLMSCEAFLKEHQANGLFMDVGSINGDKLTAATLQATFLAGKPQDVRNFGTVVVVLDSDGNEVTDGSALSHKGETTLLTDAPPAVGRIDENKPPKAGAVFTTFMSDGTPCQERRSAEVLPPPKSITVTAPNNPANRKTVICLTRANPEPGWPQPCDFGPFENPQVAPVNVYVPLAGTVVMPYPLALKDGKVDGQLQVTAINSLNGTTCSGQDNDLGSQVLAKTTPTPGNQGITWSIVGAQALVFGKTCYSPNSGLAFNMYWTVKVTKPDGRPSTVTAIVSNVLTQGSANTLIVRDVDLQWGCLPAGTLVTLADHTRKPIEDISPQDWILGADGEPWQPISKLTGEEAELIVVTAEDGTAARMTSEHPVIVGADERGNPRWLAASHLKVGTPLVTAKGRSKVKAIERSPYGGKIYNIALRPRGSDHPPAFGASFYADGLLVGDQTMQGLPEPMPVSGPLAAN